MKTNNIDLFEKQEKLPIAVQNVINQFNECDNTYESCAELVDKLNELGYSCEYGLDACPYDLRLIRRTRENFIKRTNKLLRKTESDLNDMMTIAHGGFIMDLETYRCLLRNNNHLEARHNILMRRLDKLNKILFRAK